MDDDVIDRMVRGWMRERPDLDPSPVQVLGRITWLARHDAREVDAQMETMGLAKGEFDVLSALRRAGEPFELTPSRLVRALMSSSAGMTGRLDRLQAKGLVARRAHPADRRSVRVGLTPEGRRVIDRAIELHLEREARFLRPLDESQRATLEALLRRLLEQVPPEPPPTR